ncbi:MAG: cellulase family glycosylhydrolase, partial [Actinomycetota bacterium]
MIGADLKNEPHGEATWGTGQANDWRRAAERAGNAVLAAAPNWLVIVEGIEGPVAGGQQLDRHWWGGNLEGVRNNPVRLNVANRLVYSPHEYGPGVYAQPWFSDPNVQSILADRWQKGFGYIHEAGTAPILVGEFGAKNVGTDTVEGRWIRQFADYMGKKGISWTFWAWNPNSGDTGGVLQDDWQTVNAGKMDLLKRLINREAIPYAAPGAAPQQQGFAPYVDMTLQSKTTNANAIRQSGAKAVSLGFIVSGKACEASWGGYYGLNASDEWFDARQVISDARAAGAEPIVSFGGAAGQELARTCTSASALAGQYQAVIDADNLRSIDFDVEGADQADNTSLDRRFEAVAQVQKDAAAKGRPLTVSLTLPVLPTGLTADGQNVLRRAIAKGVDVSIVHVMAMDYYDPSLDVNGKMGDLANQAATSLKGQLAGFYPGRTDA